MTFYALYQTVCTRTNDIAVGIGSDVFTGQKTYNTKLIERRGVITHSEIIEIPDDVALSNIFEVEKFCLDWHLSTFQIHTPRSFVVHKVSEDHDELLKKQRALSSVASWGHEEKSS